MAAQPQVLPAPYTPVSEAMAMMNRAVETKADPLVLQQIYELVQAMIATEAERAFNAAFVRAQAELQPISTDMENPQTRSRYASFGALHRAVMPIVNRHGFGVSFATEDIEGDRDSIRIVGYLSHEQGHVRRYPIPVPRETTGLKGGQAMTKTHATGSAFTYGKRYLFAGMWNIAIEEDDDGNNAGGGGGRRQPRQQQDHFRQDEPPKQQLAPDEVVDPATGEITKDAIAPFLIELPQGSTAHTFMETLQRYMMKSRTKAEFDDWKEKNAVLLKKLKDDKPQLFQLFEKNLEPKLRELSPQ